MVSMLGPTAAHELAADNDAAPGETNLLADLQHLVPTRLAQGRRDELGADVAFAEALFVHKVRESLSLL
jgi:hypothetical protein